MQLSEYQNYWYTKLQLFPFFITYAEMCIECKIDRLILPSIQSFQMRLKLPKINFIFYEYFFKAVVGDGNWKQCFTENKRLGMKISKAFAHSIIENNYFAWLFDYKNKNPGCTLQTEYDLAEQENEGSNDHDNKWIFCSDLGEIEIALPTEDGGDYELVTDEGPTKTQAKAAAEEVRKDALAHLSNWHHMQSYKKVKSMLTADTLTTTSPEMTSWAAAKEFMKKKRKSMMELKKYTRSASKKTKKDSNKFKGWSDEGKVFMVKMMKAIKDDVKSGAHAKWEKLYKKICEVMNKSDQIDQGSSSSDDEMDYSVLYAKVLSKYKVS